MKSSISKVAAGISAMFLSTAALADTGVSGEVGYLMNTLLLLICGVLVMFMAAGFAMLEAGLVRAKSDSLVARHPQRVFIQYCCHCLDFFLLHCK